MTMSARTNSKRGGFTLIELMIVVSLLAIIGGMLTTVLVRQQRFHRAVTGVTDSRARMRDIATILPTDLRGTSTAGRDIMEITDTSMQFRAFIGTAIMCRFATANGVAPAIIEVPPKTLASKNVLTSWINPPAPNDIAYLYDDGTLGGNADDSWQPFMVTDTTSAANSTWCPVTTVPPYTTAADNAARRYRITLSTAPNQGRVRTGAPIRFAREVRYSVYQATDGKWYVGFQRCTPNATYGNLGTCGDREVLAGPVLAGSADTLSSGLFFVYYNKSGTRITSITNTDTIARISVGIRTTSESLLKATTKIGGDITGGDSIRFTIGIRNRV
jgi:prepilin-type N-terminal cleavage/methylation domain-containing protein